MQFQGSIYGHSVQILIDSGSSHSFLNSALAPHMPGVTLMLAPVSVRVADGSTMTCTSVIHHAEWTLQNHKFHSTLQLLPLSSFDLIIGMDWLEAFSPMKVHWAEKWMSIPYGSGSVTL